MLPLLNQYCSVDGKISWLLIFKHHQNWPGLQCCMHDPSSVHIQPVTQITDRLLQCQLLVNSPFWSVPWQNPPWDIAWTSYHQSCVVLSEIKSVHHTARRATHSYTDMPLRPTKIRYVSLIVYLSLPGSPKLMLTYVIKGCISAGVATLKPPLWLWSSTPMLMRFVILERQFMN